MWDLVIPTNSDEHFLDIIDFLTYTKICTCKSMINKEQVLLRHACIAERSYPLVYLFYSKAFRTIFLYLGFTSYVLNIPCGIF